MRLSRRTVAKVETWLNKQKPAKLRKMLVEDQWVSSYEARDVEDMTDEEVREAMMSEIQADDKEIEAVLETIGVEVEYTDEDADLDEDDDDFDDGEE